MDLPNNEEAEARAVSAQRFVTETGERFVRIAVAQRRRVRHWGPARGRLKHASTRLNTDEIRALISELNAAARWLELPGLPPRCGGAKEV